MFNNLTTHKILWVVPTVLAFFTATAGIFIPNLYDGLFAKEFIPGAVPQDMLTALLCLFLFYAILNTYCYKIVQRGKKEELDKFYIFSNLITSAIQCKLLQ